MINIFVTDFSPATGFHRSIVVTSIRAGLKVVIPNEKSLEKDLWKYRKCQYVEQNESN